MYRRYKSPRIISLRLMCYNLRIIVFIKLIDYNCQRNFPREKESFTKCGMHQRCKVILLTTSFIRYEQGSDDQFEVDDDRRGKGSSPPGLPPSPGSPASPFFLSSGFLRRARQLRITYQLIAFFNVCDKRLKLPFHNTVPCDKIKGRSSRYNFH